MTTLQQLKSGLNRAWDNLAEGWRHLQQSATHALTRFSPVQTMDDDRAAGRAMMQASRWGILAAEIREKDDEITVRIEIPGMEATDFDIQVLDDVLVIRGDKHLEKSETKGHYHIMECAYGSFERALQLPVAVDETRAKAKYRHGVLHVTLPRLHNDKKQQIKVKVGT